MKPLCAAIAVLALASPILAGPPDEPLRTGTPCCWEAQFRQAELGAAPCGPTRGAILYADGKHPRLTARLQGLVWKGKTFYDDGAITNRWLGGVHAVSACTRVEPSWLDGEPCLVIQFAPNAGVLSNVRDEIRQISPGVWLGRGYDTATGHPKNWFVLREK